MEPEDASRPRRRIPKYLEIASDVRQKIKSGEWQPGHAVPSAAALCDQYEVSLSVTKKALELLKSEGKVRGIFGVGTFVADHPNLVRISPERQLQSPEVTFGDESDQGVDVAREVERVHASEELAETLGLLPNEEVVHTITRTTENGRPVSISDTYQPSNVADISAATTLEETISDQLPAPMHTEFLGVAAGDQIKTIQQRFLAADDQVIMISTVSYPPNRYDAFVFRMTLPV